MCDCPFCQPCSCGHTPDQHTKDGDGHCTVCSCPEFDNPIVEEYRRLSRAEQELIDFRTFANLPLMRES